MSAGGWRLCDADWNHWPDGLDDAGVWAAAAEGGFDGVELGVYRAADELAPERVAGVRRLADRSGVPVAMLLLSLPAGRWPQGALTSPAAAGEVAAEARATAEVAADLGLATMGLWPGADPPGGPPAPSAGGRRMVAPSPPEDAPGAGTGRTRPASPQWEAVVEGAGRVVEAVAPTGVRVALEYKPATAVATAADALALCEAVPGLGVLVDTGHAYAAGEDPAEVVARVGARLWHVHLGDAAHGNGDDDLPVGRLHDFGPFTAALAALGYDGAASLDLYGAVCAGVATGVDAGAESRAHLLEVSR